MFGAVWRTGKYEEGNVALERFPLRVANFTLCWEKSAKGFRFPSLPRGVAEYQGINFRFADAPRKQPGLGKCSRHRYLFKSQSDNERSLKLAGEIWRARRGQRRRNTMFHKVTLKRQNTLIPPQVRWNEDDSFKCGESIIWKNPGGVKSG